MSVVLESGLVEMTDEELIKHIGALYENIKRYSEAAKNDEELAQLKKEVKDLEYSKYGHHIKTSTLRLKGARNQARLRGIKFELPKLAHEE